MKRCPECEFLYGDEQKCCDMDGTVLRSTSFLPSVEPSQPTVRKDSKSIWSGLAIPLLALIVIGSALVTLYRATPANPSPSSDTHQPAGANEVPKPPVSDSPVIAAPASPARRGESSSVPATRGRDPFAQPNQPGQSPNESRLTIEPATRVQMEPASSVSKPPKPAPSQTSPSPAASQKAVARSNTISVHPQPSPDKPTPQSKTQNQDKDSKVKSLFRKAGRVLKKPF